MSSQLALSFPEESPPARIPDWAATLLHQAEEAVDVNLHPGWRAFTNGQVTVADVDNRRLTLVTDSKWAASAIRCALLDAGHAIDGDPRNETLIVTVWAIRATTAPNPPLLNIADEASDLEQPGFLLKGPDGCVELQCGAGGHNHLIAHASHPFPGSARLPCNRHDVCWQRFSWPLAERARHLLAGAYTDTGTAVWRLTPEAEQRMRALYVTYIHATRP